MSIKESLAKAKEDQPEPVLVDVVIGDDLYQIEVVRLHGQEWAGIMASTPQKSLIGYDTIEAGMLACKRHGRLLDANGEPVEMEPEKDSFGKIIYDPWDEIFDAVSGAELAGISATWWVMNDRDPNQRVVELKKSFTGGGKTS